MKADSIVLRNRVLAALDAGPRKAGPAGPMPGS
jgi:hypothetical protein